MLFAALLSLMALAAAAPATVEPWLGSVGPDPTQVQIESVSSSLFRHPSIFSPSPTKSIIFPFRSQSALFRCPDFRILPTSPSSCYLHPSLPFPPTPRSLPLSARSTTCLFTSTPPLPSSLSTVYLTIHLTFLPSPSGLLWRHRLPARHRRLRHLRRQNNHDPNLRQLRGLDRQRNLGDRKPQKLPTEHRHPLPGRVSILRLQRRLPRLRRSG